jgi:hypothetical protein
MIAVAIGGFFLLRYVNPMIVVPTLMTKNKWVMTTKLVGTLP